MRSARRLTRVFLRRFVESDLISPDADQMQVVSTAVGALFATGISVTVLMGVKYVMAPFPTPGGLAVVELDDQFLFCAWSMLVMALVTLLEWDALALDARDSAILGTLPIPRTAVVLAKLSAVVLFAAVFVAALTLAPSVLHPFLVTFAMTHLSAAVTTTLALIAAQFVSSLAAGLFGFAAALAAREIIHAILGASLFRRVSRGLQMTLLTCCATMLLLMPLASSRVVLRIVQDGSHASMLPPDWFVGLHEVVGGHVVAALPRPKLPSRIAREDRQATSAYADAWPGFVLLSRRAMYALCIASALAVGGFAWNAKRLAPPPFERRQSAMSRVAGFVRIVLVPSDPTSRAGFDLTSRTLARSLSHRFTMAAAIAVAIAASLVVVHASVGRGMALSPSLLALQPFSLAVLVAAFGQAVRLPADLRAGWSVFLAWHGRVRPYFAGVKRAAVVWIVLPTTAAFLPLYSFIDGWRAASWLALIGFLVGVILLDGLLLGQRTLPFMTEHVPQENFNMRAPVYVVVLLAGAYGFGAIEQIALATPTGPIPLAVTLAAAVLVLRGVDTRRRASWAGFELESDAQTASFVE